MSKNIKRDNIVCDIKNGEIYLISISGQPDDAPACQISSKLLSAEIQKFFQAAFAA